jgi:hypothetical protein
MPDLAEMQTKTASCRQELTNLTAMALDPSQPPDQLEIINLLARSCRAELGLRVAALEWYARRAA